MYHPPLAGALAGVIALAAVTQATGGEVCRPKLAVTNVQFSEMQPPTLERRWAATVLVDASRCTTTAGNFEIGFSGLKEIGPDLEFREKFTWSPPSVEVRVDFWADEAVQGYWIDSVQACPCAR